MTLAENAKPYPTDDITHKKHEIKNFPFFSAQSRRLATSFEGLNSSLAQLPGELWSCKVARK